MARYLGPKLKLSRREGTDLFGGSVQLAARVCDRAGAGEIVVTGVVRELLRGRTSSTIPCLPPFGETITYGEQASRMGDRNKMRAVGAANGKNPIPIVVPCHRVVGADGKLTGFAGGIDNKAWLLDHEFRVRAGG